MVDILEILHKIENNIESAFFYTPIKHGSEYSYIFDSPSEIVECTDKSNFEESLSRIDDLKLTYSFAYGYIAYESGYLFEERLKDLIGADSTEKLISFRFFNSSKVKKILTKDIDFSKVWEILSQKKSQIDNFELNNDYKSYAKNISKIKYYIEKGDTYQVNYTIKAQFNFIGEISILFLQLLFNQSANYTALIHESNRFVFSLSPELFFKTEGKTILSKPMKGTIKRGKNIWGDEEQKQSLLQSSKDKAENIMIVDLLRNDLGKISEIDSVVADPIFEIETYESVHQMTSTIKANLIEKSFKQIMKNIFPCGSITGAPKIRTMEIIKELEKEARGIYTGTIGIIDNNDFTFNIPIRTIIIDKLNNKGSLGIGGGIVWDSQPEFEYREAELKGNFLTNSENYFELIETMLFENGEVFLFDKHLNRLENASKYFLFQFNQEYIKAQVGKCVNDLNPHSNYKIRLLLNKWGNLKITSKEIEKAKNIYKAILSKQKINSGNRFQYFKTTNRELYTSEYERFKNSFYDVLFYNEKDHISEGAITNIMIKVGSMFFTPPIADGVLNGCYREFLLKKKNKIKERSFGINELLHADELLLINSVSKEISISELYQDNQLIKKYY